MKSHELSVGEVAKRAGINISTLHFYEEKGLIYSNRNQANQRRYTRDVLRRIAVIKIAQNVGISLKDIKIALKKLPNNNVATKKDWQKFATILNNELEDKIRTLNNLKSLLLGCIGCGCLSMDQCPMYNNDDELHKDSKLTGAIIINQNLYNEK
ncbi:MULTISPECIES: redox-sensitive transcriptional activator SoxR [unclassified Francisella]|uniref:redox-sensitive transcriptional activator SoxR n=1 Tax=unclassified Francisella TaxID=2610885 RepID=UPI002E36CF37|nr:MULTISPECIES: redox-sensitive transcriptional activator SoxR [unclassified Francisella]MED7819640.1 redox-sensitive transcriptional activator SoxR [Francisella sp. 19S2-4]MED7830460.1 redox-sensitive transcriptional activator SoxR [Francisella sp. 19S2-10]